VALFARRAADLVDDLDLVVDFDGNGNVDLVVSP
jgi:hypothetical protein